MQKDGDIFLGFFLINVIALGKEDGQLVMSVVIEDAKLDKKHKHRV